MAERLLSGLGFEMRFRFALLRPRAASDPPRIGSGDDGADVAVSAGSVGRESL
jgi:hypothetical protein